MDPGWHSWQSIIWITIRDHAISPLLQGVLRCVALKALTVCVANVPTCAGVPLPFSYSHYCNPLCGGDIRATICGLRKKGVSPPMGALTHFTCKVGVPSHLHPALPSLRRLCLLSFLHLYPPTPWLATPPCVVQPGTGIGKYPSYVKLVCGPRR